ncbi:MAG: NAD(P)/FAD-dependent oxidoreductase [Bacteriovoracaceae bacterium]|nr:NAD(P)/FAD-dependent oxidoreductase [Bacteriovoracaceae bacterium]
MVIGAGTGGISFSASLNREIEATDIAIIDSAEFHYYQPLWTLVGAGLESLESTEQYDGYSSCPLVVDIGKVILAEFGYDGKLMPTFPVDQSIPKSSMWYVKRYLLPALYWNIMMKGRG